MSYTRKSNRIIVEALRASLQAQLPGSGVDNAGAPIPALDDLEEIVQDCEDEGFFDDMDDAGTVANGNYGAEQLAFVLNYWSFGQNVNTDGNHTGLQLTVVMPNGPNSVFLTPNPGNDSYTIYIFNDNRGANNHGGSHVPQNDRYRGMSARAAPVPVNANMEESDEEL